MDPNFKAISEISTLERELTDTDLLLVSYFNDSTKAGYETRNVEAVKLQGVLSAPLLNAISAAIWDEISSKLSGDLVSTNLSDLELEPAGRRPLSSYKLRDFRSVLSAEVSAEDCAICALRWNDNGCINTDASAIGQINVADIAARVANEILASLNLDKPLSVVETDSTGVKLADLSRSKRVGSFHVGDPRRIVSAESEYAAGEKIATVYYGGEAADGSSYGSTSIYNGCLPGNFTNRGTQIGIIGNLSVYNGVEISTYAGVRGTHIATISRSGKETVLYNGVEVKPQTAVGTKIATICDTNVYNGVSMTNFGTVGQPVFKLNGQTCYNNCEVVDKTSACGKTIAVVNKVPVYSGFTLEDNVDTNTTTMRFSDGTTHMLRGGIKVGSVEFLTDVGEVVAKITTEGAKPVQIRNGIDVEALKQQLADDFAKQLAELKADFEKQLADLKTWVSDNFLSKTLASRQTVAGPVTFKEWIDGNCDYASEAGVARKAKWA